MALKSAQETRSWHIWGRKTLFQMRFTQFFLRSAIFPYNSLYTQAFAYTTYFELGEPVFERALYRGIHADVIVYIFAPLLTTLRVEENLLGIYWLQRASKTLILGRLKFQLFGWNIRRDIVFQKLQNLGGKSANELIHSLKNFAILKPRCTKSIQNIRLIFSGRVNRTVTFQYSEVMCL